VRDARDSIDEGLEGQDPRVTSDSLAADPSTVVEKWTSGIPMRSERKSSIVAVATRRLPS